MRLFLEIEDEMTEEEIEKGIPPRMMRVEVKSATEARHIVVSLLPFFRKPRAWLHYCFHDEDPQKPCRRVRIY